MTGPQQPDDDLYATLGVPAEATEADIVRAYRRLARHHHPDANPDADADRFSGLADAYEILSDPVRRSAYDRTLRTRADDARVVGSVRNPVGRTGPADLHPSGWRGGTGGRSGTREVELPISFEQAALGTTATVQLETLTSCASCGGTGMAGADVTCHDCAGRGTTVRSSGGINIRHQCGRCEGVGRLPAATCAACAGAGQNLTRQDVAVRVPPGVDTGTRLSISVPTAAGVRTVPAVVKVAPHRCFGRSGNDLTLTLPVTFAEAALGAVVNVSTLTGAIAIRIPAGTPHGRTLRARGHGIRTASGPGDLLITVNIDVPSELNDEQCAALEAYAAATESPRRAPQEGGPPPS